MITATSPAINEYLRKSVLALGDLPAPQRQSLLEEIELILTEVTAEIDGDPEALLGPPQRFVAELRTAAGYGTPVQLAPTERISARRLLGELTGLWIPAARRWLTELMYDLRPGWWVVRGYLLSFVFTAFTVLPRISWIGFVPVPTEVPLVGGAFALATMIASVVFGRRAAGATRPHIRLVRLGLTLLAVAVALSLGTHAQDRTLFGMYAADPLLIMRDQPEPIPTTTMVWTEGTSAPDTRPPTTAVWPEVTFVPGLPVYELRTPDGMAFPAAADTLDDMWIELANMYPEEDLMVIDPEGGEHRFSSVDALLLWLGSTAGH